MKSCFLTLTVRPSRYSKWAEKSIEALMIFAGYSRVIHLRPGETTYKVGNSFAGSTRSSHRICFTAQIQFSLFPKHSRPIINPF